MIGSDIRTFGSDRIRVSDRIRLNPYPIHIHSKKSDFIHIHIHYPVNGFFYCLTGSDRVGNPRIRTHLPSLILGILKFCYFVIFLVVILLYSNIIFCVFKNNRKILTFMDVGIIGRNTIKPSNTFMLISSSFVFLNSYSPPSKLPHL